MPAIRVFNALRRRLPLLQGLSANSPWWYGMDSGLASARWAVTRPYPGRGIPRALRDFEDWEELAAISVAAGGLKDASFLWWDVRLHPTHGTIEVREMDAQSSLEHVAALAALVRALACEAIEGTPQAGEPSEALSWSTFRAARDGVQATILDGGSLRPVAEIARATVARVRPVARSLGDEDALDGIEQILVEGVAPAGSGRPALEAASPGCYGRSSTTRRRRPSRRCWRSVRRNAQDVSAVRALALGRSEPRSRCCTGPSASWTIAAIPTPQKAFTHSSGTA